MTASKVVTVTTGVSSDDSEILEQHRLAQDKAGQAIEHAKRAGALLLKLKAALPHGGFLPRLQALGIKPRTAQTYMAAAQGKPMPIRALKCAARAHLPSPTVVPRDTDGTAPLLPRKPGFAAIPDHAMFTELDGRWYFIEQSTVQDHFFVSYVELVGDDDAVTQYLTRPIRGDYVDLPLAEWGLPEPARAPWRCIKLDRPVTAALSFNA